VPEREQSSRRLFDEHRPMPLLDELDEAVRGIQPKVHVEKVREHTFDVQARRPAAPRTDEEIAKTNYRAVIRRRH
jgi:hypothetical protein